MLLALARSQSDRSEAEVPVFGCRKAGFYCGNRYWPAFWQTFSCCGPLTGLL